MENKDILLQTLKRCNTIKQLHQLHAIATTTATLSLLLPNILFTITLLLSSSTAPSSSLVAYAVSVFNRIGSPTTFCYNTLIRAHILSSSPLSALLLFRRMRGLAIEPDLHTYPFSVKAASRLGGVGVVGALHCEALRFGFGDDLSVVNSLVHGYAVLHRMGDARRVFGEGGVRDVVSYNALIDGHVRRGDVGRAREVFEEMPERDSVSWGTMVTGYVRAGMFREAVEMFDRIGGCRDGCVPDNVAIVSVLSACAQLGDLEKGLAVHDYVKRRGIDINAYLSTGLVNFYSKCGYMRTALDVFEGSSRKNLFTWNAMLIGLALHGDGTTCLEYFYRMIEEGMEPDGVSFLGVLVGCSHSGLVREVQVLFENMEQTFRVPRELKHYGCMADLLGRAGLVKEALEMIKTLPAAGDVYVWGGLLAGCRAHGGMVSIAKEAARQVQKMKPADGGVFSIMADVYANAGLWDDLVHIRSSVKAIGVKRNAGCSLIKLNGVAHEFVSGDDLNPD